MDVYQAINLVARHVIDCTMDGHTYTWESYPDLTEADWHSVCDEVENVLRRHIRPSHVAVERAYQLLSERAETP